MEQRRILDDIFLLNLIEIVTKEKNLKCLTNCAYWTVLFLHILSTTKCFRGQMYELSSQAMEHLILSQTIDSDELFVLVFVFQNFLFLAIICDCQTSEDGCTCSNIQTIV